GYLAMLPRGRDRRGIGGVLRGFVRVVFGVIVLGLVARILMLMESRAGLAGRSCPPLPWADAVRLRTGRRRLFGVAAAAAVDVACAGRARPGDPGGVVHLAQRGWPRAAPRRPAADAGGAVAAARACSRQRPRRRAERIGGGRFFCP